MTRLYKGPLFGDKDFPWSEMEKERMFRSFSAAAKHLARGYMNSEELNRAEHILLHLLTEIPLDEEAHELLLTVYCQSKDRVSFRNHYEKLEKLLKLELGVKPSPEIQRMRELIL
jgi:two-component SAPR family response regulator